MSPTNNLDAILSISRTIFVCIALTIGAVIFNNDVQNIILNPIETMLRKVQKITNNPLQAAMDEEEELLII